MFGVTPCRTSRQAFWYLWVAYFSLYLCRLNLAAALPAMLRAEGFSVAQGGWIGSGFFACYAIGQVVNGFSSDHFGPRRMLALGLLGSAVVNLAFSSSHGLEWLVVLWALNGFFQSMGWPACVRAMADWFPLGKRGRLFGLFATSYHAGNISALLLSGWICATMHWRNAFLIPSIPLFAVALLFYLGFRNRPAGAHSGESQTVEKRSAAPPPSAFGALFSWRLLLVGLSVSAMSVVGYGFLFWAPTYLAESRNLTAFGASKQSLFLPLAGAVSVAFSGWVTDVFFHSRRMPAIAIMSAVAALLVFLFPRLPLTHTWQVVAYLSTVGLFAYGPHGLLVGVVAMDLVPREMSGRAAGILDAFGYLGAMVTGAGTGWLAQHHGWPAVFPVWSASLLLCALLCAANALSWRKDDCAH